MSAHLKPIFVPFKEGKTIMIRPRASLTYGMRYYSVHLPDAVGRKISQSLFQSMCPRWPDDAGQAVLYLIKATHGAYHLGWMRGELLGHSSWKAGYGVTRTVAELFLLPDEEAVPMAIAAELEG